MWHLACATSLAPGGSAWDLPGESVRAEGAVLSERFRRPNRLRLVRSTLKLLCHASLAKVRALRCHGCGPLESRCLLATILLVGEQRLEQTLGSSRPLFFPTGPSVEFGGCGPGVIAGRPCGQPHLSGASWWSVRSKAGQQPHTSIATQTGSFHLGFGAERHRARQPRGRHHARGKKVAGERCIHNRGGGFLRSAHASTGS